MKIEYLQLEYGNTRKKKKKHKFLRFLLILFILLIICFVICFAYFSSKYGVRKVINKGYSIILDTYHTLVYSFNEIKRAKIDIYADIDKDNSTTKIYVNNNIVEDSIENINIDDNDVKLLINTSDITRLVSYPNGYYIDLPNNLSFDFTLSKHYIIAENENLQINISCDVSPYTDTFEYINYYQNRFYLDENYQKENNIVINENRFEKINGYNTVVLSLTRNTDSKEYKFNTYTYAFIQTEGKNYVRIMFKTNQYTQEFVDMYNKVISSLVEINKKGKAKNYTDLYPIRHPYWGEKTTNLYDSLVNSNNVKWGVFVGNSVDSINNDLANLETKLENNFDAVLIYNHLGNPLPMDTINLLIQQEKVIELTVQTSYYNNEKLFAYTPMFDIIDGKKDDEIRHLARELKTINTPILFRLNNEMNSDWASYSGIVCLSDPQIYITVWQRIYDIFMEEGVANCIWIFNPNDNNYPPSNWNNFLSYYPGNEYVQLLGITGYNTGTYYTDKNGEVWREFKDIYDEINNQYIDVFGKFSWVITEFASSSVGGDKANWITSMFENIKNYPNIKFAVWFNSADYDPDYPDSSKISRPYWLDETEQTLNAFKNGFKK